MKLINLLILTLILGGGWSCTDATEENGRSINISSDSEPSRVSTDLTFIIDTIVDGQRLRIYFDKERKDTQNEEFRAKNKEKGLSFIPLVAEFGDSSTAVGLHSGFSEEIYPISQASGMGVVQHDFIYLDQLQILVLTIKWEGGKTGILCLLLGPNRCPHWIEICREGRQKRYVLALESDECLYISNENRLFCPLIRGHEPGDIANVSLSIECIRLNENIRSGLVFREGQEQTQYYLKLDSIIKEQGL